MAVCYAAVANLYTQSKENMNTLALADPKKRKGCSDSAGVEGFGVFQLEGFRV